MAFVDDLAFAQPPQMGNAYPSTESLLSDEIWEKFEFGFAGLDEILANLGALEAEDWLPPPPPPTPPGRGDVLCPLRHHDCMWAGHCASKEHAAEEPRLVQRLVPAPLLQPPPPPPPPRQDRRGRQQSLLKPAVRAAAAAHVPQTPPMSDDEEARSKPTRLLQMLNQAISECDLEDDSDLEDESGLKEYFGDGEDIEVNVTDSWTAEKEEDRQETESNTRKYQHAAENDHSYHKDKNASMRMASLGIDTPSDSEEEIDVVTIGEKLSANSRMVCSLPTNPSTRDRHHIQRRMATAIRTQRTTTAGIKTILPIRKAPRADGLPVKARKTEPRGMKRSRQQKHAMAGAPPIKRRACHSSDSEPEPSEKRSLHNNMERQRRIDLRNAFEDLRLLVPEVSKKERAAKVVILREAALYCDHLGSVSQGYTRHLEELKRHQDRLRSRVSQLRRSLAAKR